MKPALRLLVISHEFPYPPNHGGRADVWRRLCAFRELGVKVVLVCWFDELNSRPTDAELKTVKKVVDELITFPKRRGLRADIARLWHVLNGMPSHVASRQITRAEYHSAHTTIADFKPQAILIDSVYGGLFATQIQRDLNVPLFYRSHNVEHRYFSALAKDAVGLKSKLSCHLACLNIESYELRLIRSAERVFDISEDDADYWRQRGIANIECLPPLPEASLSLMSVATEVSVTYERDLAFLGNLNTPNNVAGVVWLATKVMPLVWLIKPDVILTIAGSNPSTAIQKLAASNSSVVLVPNVESATHFLNTSKVLVNPALSGSGVNIKTIDMLMTDCAIICTTQGLAGLPQVAKAHCTLADTPVEFSQAILRSLDHSLIDIATRRLVRSRFTIDAIREMLSTISLFVHTPAVQRIE